MPANYLNAFAGPDLALIDRSAYSNALMRNDVQRLPQRNAAEDVAMQGDQQAVNEQQRQTAAGVLGRTFAIAANNPRPRDAARALIGSTEFQSAGKVLGLPVQQFTVTDQDTDETIRQQLHSWAQAFGAALPERYAQEQGPDGALLQRNLGNNQVQALLGREPQQSTPASGPAPPSGYRYKADGSLEATPGGPADPYRPQGPPGPKSMTEGDKRHALMYDSMINAEQQIASLSGGTDTSSKWDSLLGLSGLGVAQSDAFKQYEAAGLRWAANMLYMKSGATATPDEIRSTWRQFFPQPGDGLEVKQQKDAARQQELAAAARITGNQFPPAGGAPQSAGGGTVIKYDAQGNRIG